MTKILKAEVHERYLTQCVLCGRTCIIILDFLKHNEKLDAHLNGQQLQRVYKGLVKKHPVPFNRINGALPMTPQSRIQQD